MSLIASLAKGMENGDSLPIRIGITPAFTLEAPKSLDRWRDYLEPRLGRTVEFVVRDRYEELIDAVARQRVDFAWVSDYPYVLLRNRSRLVAVPLMHGKTTRRSLFIVATSDQQTTSIADFHGKVFAYSDPYSLTGYIVPRRDLIASGENPDQFFRKAFFSWGHSHTVMAVANGLADGGYVDEFVWNGMHVTAPEIAAKTRVVLRSEAFPGAPIIARSKIDAEDYRRMVAVLTQMQNEAEGKAVLQQLQIDSFGPGRDRDYDQVARLIRSAGRK